MLLKVLTRLCMSLSIVDLLSILTSRSPSDTFFDAYISLAIGADNLFAKNILNQIATVRKTSEKPTY